MNLETSHYVVTAHPPGGVLHTVKCNFLSADSEDIVIAKSRSLEVRQLHKPSSNTNDSTTTTDGGDDDYDDGEGNDNTAATTTIAMDSTSPFPIVLQAPINGRITSVNALHIDSHPTALLFITTSEQQYAVIGYNPQLAPHYIQAYAGGNLKDEWNQLGSIADCGPIVVVDPHSRCIALHWYDGLVTIFPILGGTGRQGRMNLLGPVFHARLEERTVLAMTILQHNDPVETPPHLCLLHQDSRGAQHIVTHIIDLRNSQVLSVNQMSLQQQQQQQQRDEQKQKQAGTTETTKKRPRPRNHKQDHWKETRKKKKKEKREAPEWAQRRWEDVVAEMKRREELEKQYIRSKSDQRMERRIKGMIWRAMKICRSLDERAGCPPTFVNGLWAPLYEQETFQLYKTSMPSGWEYYWDSTTGDERPAKRIYRHMEKRQEQEEHPNPQIEQMFEKARKALATNKYSFYDEPRKFLDEIIEYLRDDHEYRDMDDDLLELQQEERYRDTINASGNNSSSQQQEREYDF
mmetsp:Transcript_44638/g.108270  ORF Transcript_44638/g.108270 Transcript_44638/m.108270 type:complete len:518 (+) Transcript_44638:61-1614(+)